MADADEPTVRHNRAVALTYNEADSAPRVVAKGYGHVADTIIERAREHGLYIHNSPELVGLLMQVDLDDKIPPELYRAVAELLAWVYELDAATRDQLHAEKTSLSAKSDK